MIYMKHKKLGNGHFPVEELLDREAAGWVWFAHGEHLTRPVFAAPTAQESVSSSLSTPTPTGAAPLPKRGPGRPPKVK